MKKITIIIVLMSFLFTMPMAAQKLLIYKKAGGMEEFLLSDIKLMKIKDMADNYTMFVYSGGSQSGSHSTNNIDSIKFISTKMQVYHNGTPTEYAFSDIDSVVFKIDSGGFESVTIGTQVWMLKNLDVVTYRNGDTIPQVTDPTQWANLKTGAWCYYNNDPTNGAIYGKLYNWYAVNDPRGLAPSGWHVPSDAEWTTLSDYLGGESVAGGKMKEAGTTHWQSPNAGATNSSGFAGLPGGFRREDGYYFTLGIETMLWSSTVSSNTEPWSRYLYYNYARMDRDAFNYKVYGFSVRCVKDEVIIGTQTWQTKNLDVATYRNGDTIQQVIDPTQWEGVRTGAWCYYNNDPANGAIYGKLYNWYAVNDPRGLAPSGWHVPSNTEFLTLVSYLGGDSIAGGKMKETGTTHWNTPNTGATNSTGLTCLPGGSRYYSIFKEMGALGSWWLSDSMGGFGFYMWLNFSSSNLYENTNWKIYGYSVLCVKDESKSDTLVIYKNNGDIRSISLSEILNIEIINIPSVTTSEISNITPNSASCGGNITDDGGDPISTRGVCWLDKPNPTIANSKTIDGSGIGSFTSNLTGLTQNTTYYVRAYATNSVGTAYGEEKSFKTAFASTFSLYAWGDNRLGALGIGTNVGAKYMPTKIDDNDWIKVAAGADHSLAIKSDNSLWAWGTNTIGQLGDNTKNPSYKPILISSESWKEISASNYFSVAIKSDGSLWAWGANDVGQLGDGSTTEKLSPVKIGTDKDWKSISAGQNFVLALKYNGSIWAWGDNTSYQLGDGSTIENRSIPKMIGTDLNWIQISAGGQFCLALKNDNKLYGWGANESGQLGFDDLTLEKPVPTILDNSSKWIDISTGLNTSYAINQDNTLWSWGFNFNGELGNNKSLVDHEHVPSPINAKQYKKLYTHYDFCFAVSIDDSLWGWGVNSSGQLGLGFNQSFERTPQKVGFIATNLSCGYSHTLAVGKEVSNVSDPFSVTLFADKTTICSGETIKLEAKVTPSSGNYKYKWIWVTAINETDLNRDSSIIFQPIKNGGTKDLLTRFRVEVTDKTSGKIIMDSVDISIYVPTKSPRIKDSSQTGTINLNYTINDPIILKSEGISNYSYFWYDSNKQNPKTGGTFSIGKLIEGNYTYYLYCKNDITSCWAADTLKINISVINSNISITGNDNYTVCEGQQVQIGTFNISPAGSYSYKWEKVTGELVWLSSTYTIQTTFLKLNISSDETWQYKLVVTDNNTSKTAEKTVTINVLNIPEPKAKTDKSEYYSGETAIITIQNYQSNLTYKWYVNKTDNIESTKIINGKVKVDSADVILYLGAYRNEISGCETAYSERSELKIICIKPNNVIITFNRADTSICTGDVISITANVTGGFGSGNYTYEWSGNNIISGQNSATIKVKPTLETKYTLIARDGTLTSEPKDFTVFVNQLPDFSFKKIDSCMKGQKKLLEIIDLENNTYEWYDSQLNGNKLSTGKIYEPIINNDISFWVVAKNTNGCTISKEIKVYSKDVPTLKLTSNAKSEKGEFKKQDIIDVGKDLDFTFGLNPSDTLNIPSNIDTLDFQVTFNPTILYIKPVNYEDTNTHLRLQPSEKDKYIGILTFKLYRDKNWSIPIQTKTALGDDDSDELVFSKAAGNIYDFTPDSFIVFINVCNKGGKRLIRNTGIASKVKIDPNPANESIKITYTSPEECKPTFKILDLLGTEMIKFEGNSTQTGEQTKEINIRKLQTGIYYLMMMDCSGNIIGTPVNVSK